MDQSCSKMVSRFYSSFLVVRAIPALRRKRGDRPSLKSLEPDLLAGSRAVAIRAIFDPLECRVDLRNQLSLAVASSEIDCAAGFEIAWSVWSG